MYGNLTSVPTFVDPRHPIACNFTAEELKASFTTLDLGLVYQYAPLPFPRLGIAN